MSQSSMLEVTGHAPPAVVPRWEWRIFERCPSAFIAGLAPRRVASESSRENYLLSSASPHNVKIRRGKLDVKLLEAAGPAGIERWRPIVQLPFPIARSAFDALWRAWAIEPMALDRLAYTRGQLLEVVSRHAQLRVVRVGKVRGRFRIAGCRAEWAALSIAGRRWQSLAVEDESARDLLSAVRSLGDRPTPSDYPAMLKQIASYQSPFTHS